MLDLKQIDIGMVMEVRDGITGLTGLVFSVCDQTGHLLVPPALEDPFSVFARENYEQFIRTCISKAILRKGFSIFKGSMNQYQCFIPAQIGNSWLVLVGNSFYKSVKEMNDFFLSKRSRCNLSEKEANAYGRQLLFNGTRNVSEIYGNAHQIFNLLVRESYEKALNREKYRKLRTIMEVFSDMDQDTNEEKVYDLLCDAIIFLFSGNGVSIMRYKSNEFITLRTMGKIKVHRESIPLNADTSIISEAMKHQRPVYCSEVMKLRRLGYSEDITSLYIFPLLTNHGPTGLLCVFNSQFTEDDCDSISNLCRFTTFILENIRTRKIHQGNVRNLTAIEIASLNLITFKNPDSLYESIVEVSSRYLNAERASLMLAENGAEVLSIKSMKGMNRWTSKNIRIKSGEGIAGKVYREGTPLMVSDNTLNLFKRQRPQYRTESFVSVPLKIGEETIGVLNLTDKFSGEFFSMEDMEFLRYFSSYASIAIKGAQYYQISEQMKALSVTDSLTSLFNRRYFDDRLFEELQRALRYDSLFSLAIFDIDDFKVFNDTEGHLAGDEVLKATANIARESLRSIDVIARFGGEEFSIIMPQTERDEAYLVAERVRRNIKEFMPLRWKNFRNEKITVSIGIATYPLDGKDAKTLIRNADKALYRAKFGGKDRTVVFGVPIPMLI
jgi:diguanylate cyclase (GGDEF)-like protein